MFRNFHQCLFVFFTPHLRQRISVFAHLSMCTLALIFCKGNSWQSKSLGNSRSNHNHNNIPIYIKISLLQVFQRFLFLHFPVKFLYFSDQLSGRLKTSAAEQKNGDILTTENLWKILTFVLRKSGLNADYCPQVKTFLPVLLTAFTSGKNLRDALLGNWHCLRASLSSFQDENFCKNSKRNSESFHVPLQPHDVKSITESATIGTSVVSEKYWTITAAEILNSKVLPYHEF